MLTEFKQCLLDCKCHYRASENLNINVNFEVYKYKYDNI